MKITMIVTGVINPDHIEAFQEYGKLASKIFNTAGAKPKAKYQIDEVFYGDTTYQFVSIMEFPSKAVFQQTFSSPEYQSILPLRNNAFTKLEIFLSNN